MPVIPSLQLYVQFSGEDLEQRNDIRIALLRRQRESGASIQGPSNLPPPRFLKEDALHPCVPDAPLRLVPSFPCRLLAFTSAW